MVNERDGQRRINIRQSMAVSSCASSTTICPYVHSRSAAARCAVSSASSPFIWSTSICEETMPPPRPVAARVSLANCSSSARLRRRRSGGPPPWDRGPADPWLRPAAEYRTGQRGALGAGKRRDVVVGQATARDCRRSGLGEQLVDQPCAGHRQPARFSVLRKLSFIRSSDIARFSSACSGV